MPNVDISYDEIIGIVLDCKVPYSLGEKLCIYVKDRDFAETYANSITNVGFFDGKTLKDLTESFSGYMDEFKASLKLIKGIEDINSQEFGLIVTNNLIKRGAIRVNSQLLVEVVK